VIATLITIAAPACAFVGTVLRMWDSLAEADNYGEFTPRSSRQELHRLHIFFTFLGRKEHPATTDRELYYLRTAQGWFFLAVSAFLGVLLALRAVLSE
jgi:hypothetical protein